MIDLGVNIAGMTCRADSGTPLSQASPLQSDVFIGDAQEPNTPTHMIFVDDLIGNRRCTLNLQLRALHLNAAPRRPLFFSLNPE